MSARGGAMPSAASAGSPSLATRSRPWKRLQRDQVHAGACREIACAEETGTTSPSPRSRSRPPATGSGEPLQEDARGLVLWLREELCRLKQRVEELERRELDREVPTAVVAEPEEAKSSASWPPTPFAADPEAGAAPAELLRIPQAAAAPTEAASWPVFTRFWRSPNAETQSGFGGEAAGGVKATKSEEICPVTAALVLKVVCDGHNQGYTVQESVWDATLLMGHPHIPLLDSMLAFFFLVLNCFLQGVLLWGSFILAKDSEVNQDVVNGYLMWRLTTAHSVDNYDPIQSLSLVQKVCNHAGEQAFSALAESPNQASAVKRLIQYLTPGAFSHSIGLPAPAGPLMCLCALMLWFAALSCEVDGCLEFASCVLKLPRGQLKLARSEDSDDRIRVVSMSNCRKTGLTLMVLLRLLVACTLMYTGSVFLIASERVGDLLLNVAALEIIYNIDELLFRSFMPASFTRAVEVLEPIDVPRLSVHQGKLRFVLVAFCMGVAVPLKLLPDTDMRHQCLSALCDGRKGFVYNRLEDGTIRFSQTDGQEATHDLISDVCEEHLEGAWDTIPNPNVIGYTARLVIRDKICFDRRLNVLADLQVSGVHGIFGLQEWQDVPDCTDSLDCFYGGYSPEITPFTPFGSCQGVPLRSLETLAHWEIATSMLRDAFGNHSLTSCQQVKETCSVGSDLGFLVRRWCPITCGCADPSSANYWATPISGCPQCEAHKQAWLAAHQPFSSCVDSTLEDLHNVSAGWKGNWKVLMEEFMSQVIHTFAKSIQTLLIMIAKRLLEQGCQGLAWAQVFWTQLDQRDGEIGVDMCAGEGYLGKAFKPLSLWCPQTCNGTWGTIVPPGCE